jgi:Dolichyl-phosphate-mannose-protein mannosyltransferase
MDTTSAKTERSGDGQREEASVVTTGGESAVALGEIDRWDWGLIAALGVIWAVMAVLINPIGDFPINDDWGYGLPVKWLVEEGRFQLTDWQSISLLAQVFWGSLFALVLGFSFTALRISTLTIAMVGLGSTHLLGRELGLTKPAAAVIAGLLLINPCFVFWSYSFMTDVPCLSLMILALYLLIRGLKRDDGLAYWAGWVAVVMAALIRQTALAIPIALVVAIVLKEGFSRNWWVKVLLPAVMAIFGVLDVYPRILIAINGRLPLLYNFRTNLMWQVLDALLHLRLGAAKPLLNSVGYGLMFLGLWMLPLFALYLPQCIEIRTKRRMVQVIAVVLCTTTMITGVLWFTGRLMPLGIDQSTLSLGPRTLSGEFPYAPRVFWLAVTAASALGAVLIGLALVGFVRTGLRQVRRPGGLSSLCPAVLLLVTAAVYYFLCSMNYGAWFDRYPLPLMVLLPILFAPMPSHPETDGLCAEGASPAPRFTRVRMAIALGLTLSYLGFAVASTHDYMEWNRQRWIAGLDLVTQGVASIEDIDGGFEFNNFMVWRDNRLRNDESHRPAGSAAVTVKENPQFVVSFSARSAYTPVRELVVNRWLPWSPDHVLVLERRNQVQQGSARPSGNGASGTR